MKKEFNPTDTAEQPESNQKQNNPPGYPLYPANEDIYNQAEKQEGIDPENIDEPVKTNKGPKEIDVDSDEVDEFEEEDYGEELDIPGAELDDEQEAIGNEDEENNYYSLGGDNHNDLEEDQGD